MKNIFITFFILIPFFSFSQKNGLNMDLLKTNLDSTTIENKLLNFPRKHIILGSLCFAYKNISNGGLQDDFTISMSDFYLNFRKTNDSLDRTRNFLFAIDFFDLQFIESKCLPPFYIDYNISKKLFKFNTRNYYTYPYYDSKTNLHKADKLPISYRNSLNYRKGIHLYSNTYKGHFEGENHFVNIQSTSVFDAYLGLSFNRLGIMNLSTSKNIFFLTNVYFDFVYSPLILIYGKEYSYFNQDSNMTREGFLLKTRDFINKKRFGYRFGVEIESPVIGYWPDNFQYFFEFKRYPYFNKYVNSTRLGLRISFLRKNK